MSITLTPALELDPGDYKNPEREYILSDFTPVREQFWQNCLKDSGIVGLEPYKPASWFVKLSDIDLKSLKLIIHKHSEENDREILEELNILPLIGGYVFEYQDIIIFPGCCIDLGDIFEWEAAGYCQNVKEKRQLWNGHPWLLYRSKNDLVEITQTSECGEPPEVFDVPRQDLIVAVNRAKKELTKFTIKILPITKKILPNQYKELANQLVWGKPNYQKFD